MLRQGQLHQQHAFYYTAEAVMLGQQYWLHPNQFAIVYPWPRVTPVFPGEEGATGPSEAIGDEQGQGDGEQYDDDDGVEELEASSREETEEEDYTEEEKGCPFLKIDKYGFSVLIQQNLLFQFSLLLHFVISIACCATVMH